MDIAIIHTWLLTFEKGLGIIQDGAVMIEDNHITYAGKTSDCSYKSSDIVIDGSNHVTMPGLINAHIHSGLTLLRGCAQDVPEIEWMNRVLTPLAQHMSAEDRIISSKLGVLEGIRYGTTTFSEYCANCSQILEEVYLPFGARVVATETINELNRNNSHSNTSEFDRSTGEEALKATERLFNTYDNHDMVTCLYGPQALDMVSLKTLKIIKEMAHKRKCGIHMHVAQGERERLQIKKRYGTNATTVKIMNENNLLDNLIAVHIHDTTHEEKELLVKKNVKMVGCPSSIAMIDGITPPLHHYLELGGIAGLGTDQAPGPGTHNMFREMRTASILTKTTSQDPTALPAWTSLQLATVNGAAVLGLKDVGTLEVGKKADIITINLDNLNLTPVIDHPFKNFVPNLAYSCTGAEVDTVIINGKLVMHHQKSTEIDEKELMKEANKRAQKVIERAEKDWYQSNSTFVEYVKKGLL
ncbi:MAG: amidohydrolase family protein [Theionarchaea archaeon]|nr:amidohydrolase family protein [Theionarchaea archaeon]